VRALVLTRLPTGEKMLVARMVGAACGAAGETADGRHRQGANP